MKEKLPKRKSIRLKQYDYSSPGAYFLTICTDKRKNMLWRSEPDLTNFKWEAVGANCVRPRNLPLSAFGLAVEKELELWHRAYDAVSLRGYVIMPNHIHVMVVILADELGRTQFAPTLQRMVKQFKGSVTKKIGASIWQKSFMEHIVRDGRDYETRMKYIIENPVRWYYDDLYSEE